ncbi:VOC family protein [Desulfocastanea catecholica]
MQTDGLRGVQKAGSDVAPLKTQKSPVSHTTPAISFIVNCTAQSEIDQFWPKLSEGGEKSRCAWLTGWYGVSRQLVPAGVSGSKQDSDTERSARVMKAPMQRNTIDFETLQQAYQ